MSSGRVQAARSCASNSAIFANNSRMIAWASGGWLGNDFFRDSKRHAPCVAKIAPRVQINLPGKRPQGVNGYRFNTP